MKKTNLFAVLALAATPAFLHAQTTSYSDVVGYNQLSFPAGNSAHTATFVKANVFQGAATSRTANSLTVSSATFGSLAPAGGLPTHYVKITSGAMEGYVLDILSNTSTSVTVDGNLSTAGSTPSFVIRPHVKASDLFVGNTSLSPGSDTLTLFNDNGTSTVLLWAGIDSPTGWIDPISEAIQDAVVYPGQGFLLTSQSSGSFTSTGTVETSPVVVPLYSGAVNLVTRANPSVDPKSLQSINLGQDMAVGTDTVEFLATNGSLASAGVYLWAGTDGFIDALSEMPTSVTVGSSQVLNVTVIQPTTWKVSPPTINP